MVTKGLSALSTPPLSEGDGHKLACTGTDGAESKCRVEVEVGIGSLTPGMSAAKSEKCNDHLPGCKITSSHVDTAPLTSKIENHLKVAHLIRHHVFEAAGLSVVAPCNTNIRDLETDKVSHLKVHASHSGKPSGKDDFFVSANGVVTVMHNPDFTKAHSLSIAFESNPSTQKNQADLTAQEKAGLASQKMAINKLTEYVRGRYGDPKKWDVTDSQHMVAKYLKSPDMSLKAAELAANESLPPGAEGGVPSIYRPAGPFFERRFEGAYPGRPSVPAYTSPYTGSFVGPSAGSRWPFMGRGREMALNPGYHRPWNEGWMPRQTFMAPTAGTYNFEITSLSLLEFLADEMGIDEDELGSLLAGSGGEHHHLKILKEAIAKLEKTDPKLAHELSSPKFQHMMKSWAETGKAPSYAELTKALPKELGAEIRHDLINKYTPQCKNPDGTTNWNKVGASVYVGHVASAQEVQKYEREHIDAYAGQLKLGEGIPESQRLPIITEALKLAGINNPTYRDIWSMNIIAQRESNWKNALNTWDINAQLGHPSIGPWQTIGPTFQRYAVSGHTNILDPVDNGAAALRYMGARYGGGNIREGLFVVASRSGGY